MITNIRSIITNTRSMIINHANQQMVADNIHFAKKQTPLANQYGIFYFYFIVYYIKLINLINI
jgi:hypothetical protein